jgi:hypothetical protein
MKQYQKHYQKAIHGVTGNSDTGRKADRPIKNPSGRNAPDGVLVAGLTKTQVLTGHLEEARLNYIENAFKEWEKWLSDYRLRQITRPHHKPFTLTDFQNL